MDLTLSITGIGGRYAEGKALNRPKAFHYLLTPGFTADGSCRKRRWNLEMEYLASGDSRIETGRQVH